MLAPQSHALAAREAGRTQIVAALQQQAAQWPQPPADAACDLHSQAQPQLACDSDALQQIVAERATTLAGLLAAYRSIDPSAERLVIMFAEGRYALTPAQRIGASVTSMPRDVTVTAPGL